MNVNKAYETLQEACEIKKGDIVKVLRAFENDELGEMCGWVEKMEDYVGKEYTVAEKTTWGYVFEGCAYSFPFFVLEKVGEVEIKIPVPEGIISPGQCQYSYGKGIIRGGQELFYDYLGRAYGINPGPDTGPDTGEVYLVPCEFLDIKVGDVFFTSDVKDPDFSDASGYAIRLDEERYIFPSNVGDYLVPFIGSYKNKNYWKVVD